MFVLKRFVLSSHPVDIGLRTEMEVANRIVQLGYDVFLPLGHNHRYDLIVDLGERLLRVQCKTGRISNGAVRFPAASIRSNTRRAFRRVYDGEIDAFGVHCPDNGQSYLVPIEDATRTIVALRLEPTVNGQRTGIRWAGEYVLPQPSDAEEPETGLEPVQPDLQGRCSTS
jgi:hypothetical protein